MTYPAGSKLGLSVIQADSNSKGMGNTMVDSVEATGQSQAGGVRQGDTLVSINDRYIAFEPNTETVTELRRVMQANQNLVVYFSRYVEISLKMRVVVTD